MLMVFEVKTYVWRLLSLLGSWHGGFIQIFLIQIFLLRDRPLDICWGGCNNQKMSNN